MKKKKDLVIIFDFDGTIADTFAHSNDIFRELSKKFNFRNVDIKKINKSRNENIKDFFKKLGVPFYKFPLIMEEAKKILGKRIDLIEPTKGMAETLNFLKNRGYKIGILSSNTKENVKVFLENNNLDFFNFIYSGNNIFGKDKILRKIIKKDGLDSAKIFYVGDEERDVEAAKKAGIKSIAVSWGSCSEELLLREKPDFIVKKPKDLILLLNSQN